GQALHQEARRDQNGVWEGQSRGMGSGGEARPRDVRACRRPRAARARGDAPRGTQAAGAHQVRAAGGRMKPVELRDLSDSELLERIQTARRELFGLRFQHATGELDNTAGLGAAKREIARALTIARERDLNIERNG